MRRRRKRKRRRKEEEEKEEKKEKRGGGEEILAGPPIEGSTRDPRRPKNGQFGTSITKQAIWHLNFFRLFSSRLLPKICWSCYICQILIIESPVKSIPVPNRALRHTKILCLLLILLMGMFYSVKLYQMKCFIFNCRQKGSVTCAKLSRCHIVHFQLLVPNCPGSELSGCHIVRF